MDNYINSNPSTKTDRNSQGYTYEDIVGVVGVSCDEQETTLSSYRGDKFYTLWTSDSTVLTKLRKRMKGSPDGYRLVKISKNSKGEPVSYCFEITKNLVSFRSVVKREYSAEHLLQMRENRAAYRNTPSMSENNDLDDDLEDEEE